MYTDPAFWLALGGTAAGVALLVLKFVAPRTATTKDDKLLKLLEEAIRAIHASEPVKAESPAPSSPPSPK